MTKLTLVANSPFPTKAPGSIPYSVAFSPNGQFLATANNADASAGGSVSLFAVQSGTLNLVAAAVPTGALTPTSVAFSPDSSLLATANYGSNSVSVFNVKPTGPTLLGPPFATGSPNKSPYSVAFRPTSPSAGPGLLVAANWLNDNTLSVFALSQSGTTWSVSTPKSFVTGAPLGGGNGPEEVACHPGGRFLATANFMHGTISLFSIDGSTLVLLKPLIPTGLVGTVVNTLAFSPKGNFLVTGAGLQPTVLVFKFTTSPPYLSQVGAPVSTGAAWGSNQTNSVAFHPSNDLLAVASSDSVSLLAVAPNGVLTVQPGSPFTITGDPGPRSVAFHPSGKLLAVGTGNGATGPAVSLLAVG